MIVSVVTDLYLCPDENVQELAVELVQLGFISEVGIIHTSSPHTFSLLGNDLFLFILFVDPAASVFFRVTSRDLHLFLKRPFPSSTAGTDHSIR